MTPKKLRELADELFAKKQPLTSLHQEIAENFYPERADFTLKRSLGTDFAANLMSSYPIQCRRELGNSFSTILRPTAKPWFHTRRRYVDKETSSDVRAYLEWFEETQRRAMYDRWALFTRATKEGDNDYAAFGQCAISTEFAPGSVYEPAHLLYRAWHLRDMAWQENEQGRIGFVARRWNPTAQTAVRLWKDKLDEKVRELESKEPFAEVHVVHIVCDAQMYDDKTDRPRWSIWYDMDHDKLIEAIPIWHRHYTIPRWQTVSGSQYSYSPATVCALPDARLLQAMTFTLLEAGEKATSPPVIATQGAVRSDVALYASGITWIAEEYDERLGDALRPLNQDFRGFNYGLEMNRDTRAMLHSAFFLNKLAMPERAPEMTAYEVGQRVQEYIRGAIPLFEPVEEDYNGGVCEDTFCLMWHHGGFGPVENWPKELRTPGRVGWQASDEISFSFESPLHDAIEQQKGQQFIEASQLIAQAIALDPSCADLPKAEVALRDALQGIGVPEAWLNNEAYVQDAKRARMAQQQAAVRLQAMEQASGAAKNLGQSGLLPTQ